MANLSTQKRLSRSYGMLLIICLAIIIDEAVDNILIESILPLHSQYSWLNNTFIVASFPFALLLGGWSDFHCRRKTLIFALWCILASIFLIGGYIFFSKNWMAFASLIIKAIGGNATPIALASILDIMPKAKFKSSVALAICAYSLGSWGPIYLRNHLFQVDFEVLILCIICMIIVYLWFKDYEFDGIKLTKNRPSLNKFVYFLKKEIRSIFLFITTPLIGLFYLGFIFSEISFYQILLRSELLEQSNYYAFATITLGISYYFGTSILFFLEKKGFNEIFCAKLGILIVFASIILITFFNSISFEANFIYILLLGAFSVGFSFFTPSIYALLSNKRTEEEQGKIYGLLDSTDSVAVIASIWYINKTKWISHVHISLMSLILFIICSIIILTFIKLVKFIDAKNPPF